MSVSKWLLKKTWNIVTSRPSLGAMALVASFDMAVQEGATGAYYLDNYISKALASNYCGTANYVPAMLTGASHFALNNLEYELGRNNFGRRTLYDRSNYCSTLGL